MGTRYSDTSTDFMNHTVAIDDDTVEEFKF